jgi:soluble epoxide hydrolase/lipid-phosphate phosphatase
MPIQPPNESVALPSGTKYAYHYYPASSVITPTLLFLHGFPSTSHDWHYQISHFMSNGYGVLAPDLLGYGFSSKPLDVNAYRGDVMAADILKILVHEKLASEHGEGKGLIGIAHDWGTFLLSQLTWRYPKLFRKLCFISVPYQPPGRTMNVENINTFTRKELGYEQYGYWEFFNTPQAGKILGAGWESFFEVAYAADSSVWKKDFAGIGDLGRAVKEEKRTKVGPWLGPNIEEEKEYHHNSFGDDYTPPLNWYKRAMLHLGVDEERDLLKKRNVKEMIEGKDVLFVGGKQDAVCGFEKGKGVMGRFVEKGRLRTVNVEGGHWVMMENSEWFNEVLERFIGDGVRGERAMI